MTRDEAKDLFVAKVTEKQGCKAIELVSEKDIALCGYPFPDMIGENKLIEIEYSLPHHKKSFLIPAVAAITLRLPVNRYGQVKDVLQQIGDDDEE